MICTRKVALRLASAWAVSICLGGNIAQAQVETAGSSPVADTAPTAPSKVETLSAEQLTEKYDLPVKTEGEQITLSGAMEAANKRNLTLAAMKAEIAVAQGKLKTSLGGVLPVIQGSMGYTLLDHADQSSGFLIRPQNDVQGSIAATMPIINPRAWFGIKVAKEAVALAEMNVEAVRQQLLLNVAEIYISCLMAEELIDLNLAALASADYHRDIAEARFKAGAGMRIDVVRAESDVATSTQQIVSANLAFDSSRDALAVLIDSEGLPYPDQMKSLQMPDQKTGELEKMALANRDDLKAARAAVALQRIQVKKTAMRFLPYISGTWRGSYQMTEPGDLSSSDRSRMLGLFSLVVPLYDHYRYGELDTRRATVAQSEIELTNSERGATAAVRQARRDYLAALASMEIALTRTTLSKEALELSESAYSAGTGSSLDVTEARRTSLQADINRTNRDLQSQIALLNLLYSIGQDIGVVGQ